MSSVDKAKLAEEISGAIDLLLFAQADDKTPLRGMINARIALESLLLSQQAELEALRKLVDEAMGEDFYMTEDWFARATELRAKGK